MGQINPKRILCAVLPQSSSPAQVKRELLGVYTVFRHREKQTILYVSKHRVFGAVPGLKTYHVFGTQAINKISVEGI